MKNIEKYAGIFPAFYACYDDAGEVSPPRIRALARYLADAGVQGLYVGGSSGECIYLSPDERKRTLETVLDEVGGELRVIAHVACNNTRDSMALAAHAEQAGADAIAAIPPIYFKLPQYAIRDYWLDISSAAPNTDFIIYNIPQLAGVSLTPALLSDMLQNPRTVGVKNSSLASQDIQQFRDLGGEDFVVFNGPDEQLLSGLVAGATGGIGGTYAIMPELYLAIHRLYLAGDIAKAQGLQNEVCRIIFTFFESKGNMYSVIKGLLKQRGMPIGDVRKPLPAAAPEDAEIMRKAADMIDAALQKVAL